MKRILKCIGLLLIPIIAYYGVFIAFEPNNYFGLREAPLRDSDIIAKMRRFEDHPTSGVVIGDSRLVQLDLDKMDGALDTSFSNLAYGGASLTEMLDLLEWLDTEGYELDELIFGLSFYTLNAGYAHDRMIVQAKQNPFVYMTNLTYNINMLETLQLVMHNVLAGATGKEQVALGGGEDETRDPADYEFTTATNPATGQEVEVRTDLLQYATESIGEKGQIWKVNEKELERLNQWLERYLEKGTRVTVVLPPVEDSVWQWVIGPNQIDEKMVPALQSIRDTGAVLLDYEFENRPGYAHDQFFDGLHLDVKRGLPVWNQQFLEDLQAER